MIFGARSVEQLEANLAGAELALTPAQLAALDQASAFDLGYPVRVHPGHPVELVSGAPHRPRISRASARRR